MSTWDTGGLQRMRELRLSEMRAELAHDSLECCISSGRRKSSGRGIYCVRPCEPPVSAPTLSDAACAERRVAPA